MVWVFLSALWLCLILAFSCFPSSFHSFHISLRLVVVMIDTVPLHYHLIQDRTWWKNCTYMNLPQLWNRSAWLIVTMRSCFRERKKVLRTNDRAEDQPQIPGTYHRSKAGIFNPLHVSNKYADTAWTLKCRVISTSNDGTNDSSSPLVLENVPVRCQVFMILFHDLILFNSCLV